MKIIIHRGTKEIGGTCIQLSTDRTTILLDLGLPLRKDSKALNLSGIKKDAVLISHPHADHYGLIDTLEENVPVYIGELGKKLIDATRILLSKELQKNDFHHFKSWEPFTIGDFIITPYLVDHSACDAYAFLIEADDKRVFYSGDFRGHGRKSVLFRRIIENPPRDIDLLFMEGSMLGRNNDDYPDEKSVEKKIFEIIKDQKNITFLICSSQNIDRIVSAFKACLKARKTLVLDFYTAWVLELLKNAGLNVPAMDWNNIRVFAEYGQDKKVKASPEYFGDFRQRVYTKYRIRKEALYDHPERYVCVSKMSRFRIVNTYKKEKPVNVIYSQWKGYLDDPEHQSFGSKQIADYRADPMVNFTYAHTSGHAPVHDLQLFAKAINAKMVIPIHTEFGDNFKQYFSNIVIISDLEVYFL
ncbi:MAG TPA: MBL fold metallo-hydrolase [Thermodesulfovibrionales bacterium]|nr:MBL fold metallo-hydrolase [Thermodesulfovibrionales bacterium]